MRTFLSAMIMLVLLSMLVGCGGYQLRGRVIEGSISTIAVVQDDDPRLTEQGQPLGGAVVEATIDPKSLNRTHLPSTVSQYTGVFSIPVHETGAGFLEYDVQVEVRLPGHASAEGNFALPRRGQQVLVILAPGEAGPTRSGGLLDETLELSEPYLQGR